jgi:hypothetical protein
MASICLPPPSIPGGSKRTRDEFNAAIRRLNRVGELIGESPQTLTSYQIATKPGDIKPTVARFAMMVRKCLALASEDEQYRHALKRGVAEFAALAMALAEQNEAGE